MSDQSDHAERETKIAILEAQLEHRERQIEAIRRTGDALLSHASVDDMVRELLRVALDIARADAGTVYLHDPSADTLVFRYVIGGGGEALIGQHIPAAQGIAGTVFRTGAPILTGNVSDRGDFNPTVDEKTGYHTESMMTVPIKRVSGAPIGVMQVLNAHVPPFTGRDLEVLEVLCAQAATGIQYAQLLEEARKAEIGNRVGEIAHDIKNMMTPIQTGVMTLLPMLDDLFTDLDKIHASCPDAEPWGKQIAETLGLVRQDYRWMLGDTLVAAERVRRRTEYIAGLVKGTLPPPRFEEGSLNAAAQEVAKTLRRVAREREVQLETDLDGDLPASRFDYDRLYDALYNLVNNAIPETPPGGTVTIRTRAPQSSDEQLTLQVADTGRGIPESVRAKLFTAQAVSTKPGGTGLGTSVVARVVREHGGTIQVDSEMGSGSIFTIRLPLTPPPVPEA